MSKSLQIITLSPVLISKIAAGQVVERPSSVVKELIENALDAQASQIEIELTKSGTDKIIVVDNGSGMTKQNLLKSYLPHTTSKLATETDFDRISTFGFRGEALASMVTAADVLIQSRSASAKHGHQILIENSQLTLEQPVGMPRGTKVVVQNLFSHLPARKKFLKSNQVELQHVLQVVTAQALANPNIEIKIKHNQKTILHLTKNQTLSDRIFQITNLDTEKNFIQLNYVQPHFSLTGFVSLPQHARKSNRHFYFFVNNRPVANVFISQIIQDVYRHLIAKSSFPITVLNLTVPTDFVDVNINPQKTQVAFRDQTLIKNLIQTAITESLNLPLSHQYVVQQPNSPTLEFNDQTASPYIASILKQTTQAWETTQTRNQKSILQIHDTYLLFETAEGLTIIDQHAAHERILYEQFLESFVNNSSESVQLNEPVVLRLNAAEFTAVSNSLPILAQLGFELTQLTKYAFQIKKIPALIDQTVVEQVFKELVDDLVDGNPISIITDKTKQTIAYLACRSAVKAGDSLSPDQCKNLLDKLTQTKAAFTCPHGRPTRVTFSLSQLEKMFQRR